MIIELVSGPVYVIVSLSSLEDNYIYMYYLNDIGSVYATIVKVKNDNN